MPRFDKLADWLAWQEQLHPRPIDLGLERAMAVLKRLALIPTTTPTITVGGTNGKGSSVAFLEAIYLAQGYRVGAYTSPHILKYNERIRINGEPVGDADICDAFAQIDDARGDLSLSYFEFGTLAALMLFQRAGVNVQLLEVGLGGRLDAVNCVDTDVAIITTIDIDHTDWLGNSRELIGFEKAGIFRAGKAAIVGDRNPPSSLVQTADKKQAKLLAIGHAFDYQKTAHTWQWQIGERQLSNLPEPVFTGEHQYRNAASVLAAIAALDDKLPVTEQAIHQGLTQAKLQGRFQLIPGTIPVLLDVGHNPQAVQTLRDHLDTFYSKTRIHAVFAIMRDKDIRGVLKIMQNVVAHWYLAPLQSPRAATEQQLRDEFAAQAIEFVHAGFIDVASAVQTAKAQAQEGDLILIFGSFFLVSEYLALFG